MLYTITGQNIRINEVRQFVNQLYKINLNLLKVFSVLMQERHVTAAAKRLHVTQSAISNSLQQLRVLLQDELLIRAPKKMIPTQKALLLAPKIEQILLQLETYIFYTEKFDYKTSRRNFNLGMTDYAEYILLPQLCQKIKKIAPDVTLKIFNYHEFFPEYFESNQLDLGIGLERKESNQLMSERIYGDQAVCVARENHPIFKQALTLKRYLQSEHLAACVYSQELHRVDSALQKLNLSRDIRLTIPNALSALQVLSNSDLIGTISLKLAVQAQKKYRLKYALLPFEIPAYHIAQIWHRQQNNDSGLIWLRSLIKNMCDHH